MELRHLRYFVAVAELLHFGRAAATLRIAQPSLSHQIRQLETELQTTLLQRTKRRVQLTDAGRVFLEEARQTLAHADRAAVVARRASRGEAGPLRIAFAYWIDPTKILSAVRTFNAQNPATPVDLQAMNVPHQIAALRDERLDVGFVRLPIGESSLHSEMLVREPFVVALPASHRLAARERVSLSSLADESFVPHTPHEADHPQMVLGLVAAGMGVSLVPASARNAIPHGVVLRSLRPTSNVLQTGIAWRRGDPSPIVAGFVQIVRRVTTVGRSRRTGRRRQSLVDGTATLKASRP